MSTMVTKRRIITIPVILLFVFQCSHSSATVSAAVSTVFSSSSNQGKNNDAEIQDTQRSSTNLRHLFASDETGIGPSAALQQSGGGAPQTRIFGGWNTVDGRYGYAEVTLLSNEGHKCGGALIAPDLIISAAHCQQSESQYTYVIVGKNNDDDVTWEGFNIIAEYVHPDYNIANTRFDVMLLKIDGMVTQTQPVRFNTDPEIPENGEQLTVVGLGYTEQWTLPTTFLETTVTYTRNLECANLSNSQGQTLKNDLHLDMICAGDPGRDSCYGDSGSPLIRPGVDASTDLIVGLVSWGFECAGDLPGVYARLSHWAIQQWLIETICRESANPPAYLSCFGDTEATTEEPTLSPTPRPSPQPTPPPTPALATPTTTEQTQQQPTLVTVTLPTEAPSSGVLWDVVMGRDETEDNSDPTAAAALSTSSSAGSYNPPPMLDYGWNIILATTIMTMMMLCV
jgi:trypsin